MDHHCPWLGNCIGYWNYKYFFLVVMYSCFSLVIMAFSFVPKIFEIVEKQATYSDISLVLIGIYVIILTLFTCLLVSFLGFHIYLIINNITTLDYYENENKENLGSKKKYGLYFNFKLRFGDTCPIFWIIPTTPNLKFSGFDFHHLVQ